MAAQEATTAKQHFMLQRPTPHLLQYARPSLKTPVLDSLHARARRIAAEGRIVSVDVEAHPEQANEIFAVGAVRSDSADIYRSACSPAKAGSIAATLNSFSRDGQVLLGHNIRRHDVPLMREQLPQLACLDWPHGHMRRHGRCSGAHGHANAGEAGMCTANNSKPLREKKRHRKVERSRCMVSKFAQVRLPKL